MTYEELLRANGATDEDIKTLSTPAARRAFDAQQKLVSDATAAAVAADRSKKDYEASVDRWHNEQILPAYSRMEADSIASKAELAKAKALILAAQDQGLLKIAADAGYRPDAPAVSAAAPAFDTSKYVTQDSLAQLAESAGAGLAELQDLVMEHAQLFPDRPLKVRELRAAAVAARKPVSQYWADTYGVPAAREKRDSDSKAAYEARLRKEGEDKALQEMADRYGNPDVRPLVASVSPLAPRPESGREKMPWEAGDRSNDRVRRATSAVIAQQTGSHVGRTN